MFVPLTVSSTATVIQVTFETGSMRYKSLEQALFVGSGRFVIDERGLTVEYRISKVCKGPGVPNEDTAGGTDEGGVASNPGD